MDLQELIARRRMVRNFADEPVERAVLERIAHAAQRAPSAGFSQDQRLVVVTEPAMRRRVAELVDEEEYVARGSHHWISDCAAQFIPCVSEKVYAIDTRRLTRSGRTASRWSGRCPTGGWISAAA